MIHEGEGRGQGRAISRALGQALAYDDVMPGGARVRLRDHERAHGHDQDLGLGF